MTAKGKQKKFLFNRGFLFFWKSNLVLFLAILFLYINKSSWSEEGSVLLVLALMWEALILLLSIIEGVKAKRAESLKL
ncbi:hypothetical protein ABE67_02330 [Cytobacillus firmus]|nr:hypothetical protein [Cytobacillus firmus]PAE22807.1 hypothetical protein CHI10_21255 [Bacillus sp. 7894-2]